MRTLIGTRQAPALAGSGWLWWRYFNDGWSSARAEGLGASVIHVTTGSRWRHSASGDAPGRQRSRVHCGVGIVNDRMTKRVGTYACEIVPVVTRKKKATKKR